MPEMNRRAKRKIIKSILLVFWENFGTGVHFRRNIQILRLICEQKQIIDKENCVPAEKNAYNYISNEAHPSGMGDSVEKDYVLTKFVKI